MDLTSLLQQRFGLPAFRPGQEEVASHVASGGDALVVMPTGAGKSLCFQVPALARGGTTVVVSPLIALMKDQVDGLVERGIRAAALHSGLDASTRREAQEALERGDVELLYVAPERFSPAFLATLARVDVRLFVIDEAHCLSQWGHDFRPEYLKLGKVREALGRPPTLAATATATPEVQDDIIRTLGIEHGARFVRGFDRENLMLEVVEVDTNAEKLTLLPALVAHGPALVYAATRKRVEEAAAALRAAGVPAGLYHAGLESSDRTRVQDAFMEGRVPVVVATNAFGMGIDKSDIRTIVHVDMPGTVEAYYQEIGRAGRDGKPSRAVLLFQAGDRRIHTFFIDAAHPPAAWVHALWEGLKARGENPVLASVEEMAGLLPADAGDRAVSSCLHILVREGRARRIAPSDRPAQLILHRRPPVAVPSGLRGLVWGLCRAEAQPGVPYALHVGAWAHQLDAPRDGIVAALRGLEDRGYLVYRAPERIGGVELIDPAAPLTVDDRRMKERRSREYTKLDKMVDYAHAGCRRRAIIEYFGEVAPYDRCGTCDACRAGTTLSTQARACSAEEIVVVRKLLSALARIERHTGRTGWSMDLLTLSAIGASDARLSDLGLHTLPTHGVLGAGGEGPRWTQAEAQELVRVLAEAKLLDEDYVTGKVAGKTRTWRTYTVSPTGWAALRDPGSLPPLAFPHAHKLVRRRPLAKPSAAVSSELHAALRELRTRLARDENVPVYVVASNRTLDDMAQLRPSTKKAMLAVHGMGEVRWHRYGTAFLETIRTWQEG